MDNPNAHLDRELLSRDRMIRPDAEHPIREPTDDFETFRSIYGQAVRRGARNEFDNSRLYGTFFTNMGLFLMYNTIFLILVF